jgi:hypothetical protein
MPHDNDFEKLLQQKMEGLSLEPHPADWQAVHDALHPRRRRVAWLWWLLPAMLAGAGLWWLVAGDNVTANPDVLVKENRPPNRVELQKDPQSNLFDDQAATHKQPGTRNEKNPTSATQPDTESGLKTEKNTTPNIADNRVIGQPTVQKNTSKSGRFTDAGEPESNQLPTLAPAATVSSAAQDLLPSSAAPVASSDQINQATFVKKDSMPVDAASVNLFASTAVDKAGVDTPTMKQVSAASVSPNKPKQHKMRVAGYVGAGLTWPGSGITAGGAKAMSDMANNIGQGGGTAVSYTNQQFGTGGHGEAGALLEWPLGRHMRIAAGLGVNYTAWSESLTLYRDSILPGGAFASRSMLMDANNKYSLLLLNVPLHVSGPLGRKEGMRWWWHAGIDNRLRLQLKQHSDISTLQSGFSPLQQVADIGYSSTFYQPQITLGIHYRHKGAAGPWLLQPSLQLGLANVFKTGYSSETYFTSLNLQYLYYFRQRR